MGLAEDIASSTQRPGSRCSVPFVLAELPDDEAADLRAALANDRVPGSAIMAALKKRNIDLSDSTVNRHRRGSCKCPR